MPTEQNSPVSRRKLGIFGVVAGIAAVLVVVTGIRAREDASAKLREWTDDQAIPTVAVVLPDARALNATIDLPGRLEAYYRAPIFARVSGYLKSWSADIGAKVKAGPGDRRDRGAGPRPAAVAGARRSRQPGGQRETVGSDADAPQDADRVEFRLDAGNRRAHRRSLQQEGRGQFRPGQCRAAGGAGRLQEDHRAVRRRGHRARYRRRRPDQCRRRQRARDVRDLRHQEAAGLCQRSPELRAGDQDRRQGRDLDAGISEPDLPGDGGGLLAIGRCHFRHDADAARARQFQRRVDAGRLCQCAHEPAARRPCRCIFRPAR